MAVRLSHNERKSRLSWEDMANEDEDVEVRLDPEDDGVRTFREVHERYQHQYSPQEINTYWKEFCMPLEPEEGRPSPAEPEEARELCKALALSAAAQAEEDDAERELMQAIAMSLAEKECAEETSRTWEFYDERMDAWMVMAAVDSKFLEDRYQEDPRAKFRAQLGTKNWYYSVDLARMLQTSETTGMPRALRRTPLPLGGATTEVAGPARPADLGGSNSAGVSVQYTLKATLGSDTRRLRVAWPACATSAEALDAIRTSVRTGFALCLEETPFLLRYADNEGDVCSLVETTLEDCLLFVRDSTLKLEIATAEHERHGLDAPKANASALAKRTPCVQPGPAWESQIVSIASPPMTPRDATLGSDSSPEFIEEYSLEWSVLDTDGEMVGASGQIEQ